MTWFDRRRFEHFAPPIRAQSELRRRITAGYRRAEPDCVLPLIEAATLTLAQAARVKQTARQLIETLRAQRKSSGVEGLVREYALGSDEGIALMCLAEALLRIPDNATRDALIRDKIGGGDWGAHVGRENTLFVNAASWGLIVTGKLVNRTNAQGLAAALTRLVARCGSPVIRRGVDLAMRMMGEQFVAGKDISDALQRAQAMEDKGYGYSYDMLGEAAITADDAARYHRAYETAIHAIGKNATGRGIFEGPGISVKLSALHPRYVRAQSGRVMDELLPKVAALAVLAKSYDIGFNIDAEEADRLELSLDLLESLAFLPELTGWHGLGFVVQAYGKRCPAVLDFVIDLASRANRRIMVRLVKGAYWDAEIRRAQLDGMADFPVYTRKVHTDVAYIASAKKLLGAADQVFPQFATHNAQTVATILEMAGPDFWTGKYEFQCLYGMGEQLYAGVVATTGFNRPCRIYAPVGTHETLLAYLVRRLLENGANSSFVNQLADPDVSIKDLVVDPVQAARDLQPVGSPHEKIALPADLYGEARQNSIGIDLSNEQILASLSEKLQSSAATGWTAAPLLASGAIATVPTQPVRSPNDHRDIVGHVCEAENGHAQVAVRAASTSTWADMRVAARAACLDRAARLLQDRMETLAGLIAREAGKSIPNAISEIREAIDFLRYYAGQARETLRGTQPLGPVVCISPWNFPLAIFIGQIAAALAAGNPVLAKPAEETPLIAYEAVRILHEAGVHPTALQFLPGDGKIGAALVACPEIAAVIFTGSNEVARLIQKALAGRLSANNRPIPLIAETGGQNAMIIDSSALPEQVVADVIISAFDSAGQRCSAQRVLCLQEDCADHVLTMLKGAMRELSVGSTEWLCNDIGPVITTEAQANINRHIEGMRRSGLKVEQIPLDPATQFGTFVAPTMIELKNLSELRQEVFGPVLHILRYHRNDLDRLIDQINATGYGLTFGLHSRLDETINHVTSRIKAGNIYVNRNMIGATVGVQPFGGTGLSGTGPKAGGPLYLRRLVEQPLPLIHGAANPRMAEFIGRLESLGINAGFARALAASSPLGFEREMPGAVGECNIYALHPRGKILLLPVTEFGAYQQIAVILASGNTALIDASAELARQIRITLPDSVAAYFTFGSDCQAGGFLAAALVEGDRGQISNASIAIAARPGPVLPVQAATPEETARPEPAYVLDWLLAEVSISTNTAAVGGNASLMTML